jgi:hypothetical protein
MPLAAQGLVYEPVFAVTCSYWQPARHVLRTLVTGAQLHAALHAKILLISTSCLLFILLLHSFILGVTVVAVWTALLVPASFHNGWWAASLAIANSKNGFQLTSVFPIVQVSH